MSKKNKKKKIVKSSAEKNKIDVKKKKNILLTLGIILFVGLVLRLIYVLEINNTPFANNLFSDAKIYNEWAKSIVSTNDWVGKDVFFMAPIYPYFLAIIYKVFGQSILFIQLLQVIISTFSILLIYICAKKLFLEKVALISAAISSVYSVFVFYSGAILSETLQLFFFCLFIYYIIKSSESNKLKHWFIAGIFAGISILFRGNFLFISFLIVLYIIFSENVKGFLNKIKSTYKRILIFTAGILLIIFPVTLRNYLVGDEFVLLTSNGGINFYLGNNPNSQGVFITPQEFDFHNDLAGQKYAQKILGRNLTASETSSFWFNKGIEFITNNPGNAATLYLKKIFLFFGPNENPQSFVMNKDFFADNYSTILRFLIVDFNLISFLALFGLFLSWSRRKELKYFYLIFFGYALSTIIFFVNGRFRLALIPLFIIFSSFAIYEISNLIKNKSYKKFITPISLTSVFALIYYLFIPLPKFTDYDAYLQLGNIAYNEGKIDEAILNYEKSLSLQENYLTYVNLGNSYGVLNDFKNADYYYRKAIKLNPENPLGYFNWGSLYFLANKLKEAEVIYLKTLQVDPYFEQAIVNLANIYFITEQYEKAIGYYEFYLTVAKDINMKNTVKLDLENAKKKLSETK
ncbi:MAG: glycosyltransferase family 39 protein [Ignavibacteriales bacterium]|nr:glycosyltransferase family 39 protein [Ignavibacteriales bacterium]